MQNKDDIDLDALLSALEEAESEHDRESSKYQSKDKPHVSRFIDDLNIKTGVERVSTSVIFYTYRKRWEGLKDKNKLKKIEFFRQFKRNFTPYRTGKQRYYLLDPSSFDLSREGLLEAEQYNKSYDKEKRTLSEKRKKEKRSSVSKSDKGSKPKE